MSRGRFRISPLFLFHDAAIATGSLDGAAYVPMWRKDASGSAQRSTRGTKAFVRKQG